MTGFYAIGEVATGAMADATTTLDSTAPTLTSASATATGATTASGTVTTNESGGTLYFIATASATATAAAVQAGASKAVVTAGAQAIAFTGLPAAAVLYPHYVHVDAAGNVSAVANGASFTTQSVPDTTAPTLSAATAVATGPTTATGSVTTNEAGGTLFFIATTSATATAAAVKAGASQAVSASGAQAVSFTGLQAGATLYPHYLHRDAAGNESAVVDAASFAWTSGTIAASKVSAARRVIFNGGTRVVVFDVPSLQKDKDKDALMTNAAKPYFKDGKWWVDKDPDEKSYYVADLTQELLDRATTATSVQVLVAGVKLLEGPSIQGSLIVVKLAEMDTTAGADNFWTARVTCANTEQFDRTTWLNRVDN